MPRTSTRPLSVACAAVGVLAGVLLFPGAAPLAAQASADAPAVYRREVFEYSREGRPDPFRSLLKDPELGLRFEDLALVGVLHDPTPGRSVAVLSQRGAARRLRVREGDRVGGVRITAIGPRSVEVVVEEFGVLRRDRLELRPASGEGGAS